MFNLLKKKKENKGLVGISLSDRALSIARAFTLKDELHLADCHLLEADSATRGQVLGGAVESLGLHDTRAIFVLDPADYNILLVDAPKVQPEEMSAAIRWRIKDLIDRPVDEVAIDTFPVPAEAYRSQSPMLYAVVARKSRILEVRDMIEAAGLTLESIDIPELALRNLSRRCGEDGDGFAFIDLRETGSTLNLCRDGAIYLTRHLNTPVASEVTRGAEWEAVKERLVLEIQRSLDYYESQMGQRRISRLLVAPRPDQADLAAQLKEAMAVRVDTLDLRDCIQADRDLSLELQHACLGAIGGCLRNANAAAGQAGKDKAA